MAYNTAYDLESMVVNAKQAAVYASQENSLFLGGELIPTIQLPAGSITAQVPLLGAVTAEVIGSADPDAYDDFTANTLADESKTITASIYAARHVMRDLGGIDPAETGRVLGNAVAKKFDQDAVTAMGTPVAAAGNTTPSEAAADGGLTVDVLIDAVAAIRGRGEMGQLTGLVGAAAAAELMKSIGSNAYAGADFQNEALRNGFIGTFAGVRLFQTAYVTTSKAMVFGEDFARIAMFKNLDLEVQRRAEAVGNDVVASLHAGLGVVDADRAQLITTTA